METCGKDCKYESQNVALAVSMHHCPDCGQMQIAGQTHTCSCFQCINAIAAYFGYE